MTICEATVVEVGILTNTILGKATVQIIAESLANNKKGCLKGQLRLKNEIVGRLNMFYDNIEEIAFVDANFFSSMSRFQDKGMIAELQQFGPNK